MKYRSLYLNLFWGQRSYYTDSFTKVWHSSIKYYLSHVMRKPAFALCDNKGADQPAHPGRLISAFVICCLDRILPLRFYIQNFMPLASFYCCASRFESYLVGNPEDRFSRDEAHLRYKAKSVDHEKIDNCDLLCFRAKAALHRLIITRYNFSYIKQSSKI